MFEELTDRFESIFKKLKGRGRLSEANITSSNFSNVIFQDADLSEANLSKANFSGADLSNSSMLNARTDDIVVDEKTKTKRIRLVADSKDI